MLLILLPRIHYPRFCVWQPLKRYKVVKHALSNHQNMHLSRKFRNDRLKCAFISSSRLYHLLINQNKSFFWLRKLGEPKNKREETNNFGVEQNDMVQGQVVNRIGGYFWKVKNHSFMNIRQTCSVGPHHTCTDVLSFLHLVQSHPINHSYWSTDLTAVNHSNGFNFHLFINKQLDCRLIE